MTELIVPIILAGGEGTRLWPMSRAARPEQFLSLTGAGTLFQQTLQRVSDPSVYASAIVVTNSEYRFIVAEQASEIGAALAGVLLEPVARNTAVAIAAAAFYAGEHFGQQATLFVLPSDHQVTVDPGYRLAIQNAASAAARGQLVTFGILPTRPETGFGYVKAEASVGLAATPVQQFVEKPDSERAGQLLA